MKLTWFARTAIRIHLGGEILVVDPERAPELVDPRELVAGADRVFALADDDPALPVVDPATWRPRAVGRLIDADAAQEKVAVRRIGQGSVLIDGPGESPLVLVAGPDLPRFGRWADGAVVVLFDLGEATIATATVLLDVARPKLLALAADEQHIDLAIAEIGEHLGGAGLVSLEPGLAVEV